MIRASVIAIVLACVGIVAAFGILGFEPTVEGETPSAFEESEAALRSSSENLAAVHVAVLVSGGALPGLAVGLAIATLGGRK